MRTWYMLVGVLCLACWPSAWAGPPFVTDDPEPVELHHWEVYVSSIVVNNPSGNNGTLPHVEVNNGAAPNLQLHIIAPCAFARPPGGPTTHGLGDVELGVKYRFVQEARRRPMVGVFPLIECPTGSAARGLGAGHWQLFLPVWLQKSWGSWTTYGGGGYFINPGPDSESFWFFGWEVQKDLNKHLTLGGEIFTTTPNAVDAVSEFNFNVGGIYNHDDNHHVLFSAGRSITGDIGFVSYVGFQWTFGPHDDEAQPAPR
jgi:hypothetical protein